VGRPLRAAAARGRGGDRFDRAGADRAELLAGSPAPAAPSAQRAPRIAGAVARAPAPRRLRERKDAALSTPSPNGTHAASSDSPGAIVGGYLAAIAIFVALIGIVRYPVRIDPAAAVIALVAAGMAGPRQRTLAATAVIFVGAAFFVGMVVAVLTNHPLW
jgi:hypothetical protein